MKPSPSQFWAMSQGIEASVPAQISSLHLGGWHFKVPKQSPQLTLQRNAVSVHRRLDEAAVGPSLAADNTTAAPAPGPDVVGAGNDTVGTTSDETVAAAAPVRTPLPTR